MPLDLSKVVPAQRRAAEKFRPCFDSESSSVNRRGEVVSLNIFNVDLKRQDWDLLGELPTLVFVAAYEPAAVNHVLRQVPKLPNLKELYFTNANSTEAANLRVLEGRELSRFVLIDCRISAEMLQIIGSMRTLKNLIFQRTNQLPKTSQVAFENSGFRHFAGHPALQTLFLVDTSFDDEGLSHLGNLPELLDLQCQMTLVTGKTLDKLAALSKLQNLSLQETPLNDAGLKKLPAFPELTSLDLSQTRITDKSTHVLARLPKLSQIRLKGTRIGDATIERLAGLPNLKNLNARETAVTNAAVAMFGKCTNLKEVSLYAPKVTKAGGDKLRKLLPRCKVHAPTAAPKKRHNVSDDSPGPWEKRGFLWSHPPRCLARFKLTKKRDEGLDELWTRFGLGCPCGAKAGEVLGYSRRAATPGLPIVLLSPLSFRCGKCKAETEILDVDKDGYNGEIGSPSSTSGEGEKVAFVCPQCEAKKFQLIATCQYSDGDFDLWNDDHSIQVENYFGGFLLDGVCAECKAKTSITSFELA